MAEWRNDGMTGEPIRKFSNKEILDELTRRFGYEAIMEILPWETVKLHKGGRDDPFSGVPMVTVVEGAKFVVFLPAGKDEMTVCVREAEVKV